MLNEICNVMKRQVLEVLILMDSSFQQNPVEFKECTAINKDEGLDTVKQGLQST